MAENLDDGEFWLPPQFLTDDDTSFVNNKNKLTVLNSKNDDAFDVVSRALFPYLSSPVESVVGSSETESDEEEHMAELTRRMAHSTLELGLNHHNHAFTAEKKPEGSFVSGSPQSTLCAFGSSGKGSSPNGNVLNSQRATWDLLRAAAGEVERMRLSKENYGFVPNATGNPSPVFYAQQQALSHQQLQIAQMLRQQQLQHQHQQQHGSVWQRQSNQMVPKRGRNNNVRGNNMGLSQPAWPMQHANGFGMRAVFLGNPSGKRRSTGTGVFLPVCINNPSESRKKSACSTALVPDRVAHALNLKLGGGTVGGHLQNQQPRFNGSSNMGNAAVPKRSNNGFSQQKRNLKPQQQQQQPPVYHEIRLPQEWTY
ncbi:uncharacterized protein LOC133318397 isoform X2 [Gastrolobium bilobum]|uniref:uncharacterized protein LOC133318397 isoform X2 n=1 Tax=Gastrolobium bilobum TaxID=150636 RepID=UPI002AAF1224|nr:uncharacterized protein LOC133318397 isoform X2 [Gastrolobium bilobum]